MTTSVEQHNKHLATATAAAMQNFYNCHGDEKRWEPWEFEAEKRLLDSVRDRVNQEDGYLL